MNRKKINDIDVQIEECKKGNHDLTIIFQESSLNNGESTVRWCKRCGSVVIDADRDGRTYPGRVMGMKCPQIYQPFRTVDKEIEKETEKRVNLYAVVEATAKETEHERYRVIIRTQRHFLKPTDPWNYMLDDKKQADVIAEEINEDIHAFVLEMIKFQKELDKERHEYDPHYRG